MRLLLLSVGRLKAGPERELFTRYVERAQAIARGVGLTGVEIREIDEGRGRATLERKRSEAVALAAEMPPGARIILLDESGKSLPSAAFAADIGRSRDGGLGCFVVVIGGPDGFDADFRSKADAVIAYGAATFPHQIVRVLAAEQIYRACTILVGHPYHRT